MIWGLATTMRENGAEDSFQVGHRCHALMETVKRSGSGEKCYDFNIGRGEFKMSLRHSSRNVEGASGCVNVQLRGKP